jgi:hypothetical protein
MYEQTEVQIEQPISPKRNVTKANKSRRVSITKSTTIRQHDVDGDDRPIKPLNGTFDTVVDGMLGYLYIN